MGRIERMVEQSKADVKRAQEQERAAKAVDAARTSQPSDTPKDGKQ